jgi:penicillin-binding protein 1A
MRLEDSVAYSRNTPIARAVWKVGMPDIIAVFRQFDLTQKRTLPAAASLGTESVSLLQLTIAYYSLHSGCAPALPNPVWRARYMPCERVLTEDERAAMWTVLEKATALGTGRAARVPDQRVFGKTGTSQGGRHSI